MIKRKSAGDVLFDALNYSLLTIGMLLILYPLYFVLIASVSDPNRIYSGDVWLYPQGITFDGYQRIFNDSMIWIGYANSLLYAVVGTAISVSLTLLAAYPLSRKDFVGRNMFMWFFMFTMFFNGGLIPTYLVIRNYNLLDTIWAMILPGLVSSWFLIIMRTFFQGIPKEIEESGKMDGLTELGNLLRIVLPLSVPVLLTIALFYAVAIWGNFYNALIYIRDANLYPIQVVIRNIVLIGQVSDTTVSSAMGDKTVVLESLKYAVILVGTLPVLLFYPFIQKHFAQGVMVGSVKG